METVTKWWAAVGGVVAVISIFVFFRWACHSDFKQAQVKEVKWQHFTDLRGRTKKSDGDWNYYGQVPDTRGYYNEPIFNKRCRDREHGTWCCGGRDNNGACLMECPDYDEWCDYNYWDWPVIDTMYVEGLGEEQEMYPTFGSQLDDNHRESRRPLYSVTFAQQGKDWVYQTKSGQRYREFVVGDIWMIEIPRFGSRTPSKKSSLEQSEGK
jgi:hypothetical protein